MDEAFVGVENEVRFMDKEQVSNPLNLFEMNKFI
jgi:hypothetical protein